MNFFGQGHLNYEDVIKLSKQIVSSRNIKGFNVAGYDPNLENEPRKTTQLIKNYLDEVLELI